MSDVNFYGSRGRLVKNWNFNIERTKEKIWTVVQTYHCHVDDTVSLMPSIGSRHPDFNFCKLEDVNVSGMEGDWVDMQARYIGVDPDAEDVYTRGLRMNTGEEHVATSPYFSDVPEADRNEAVKLATQPPKNKDGQVKLIDTTGWDEIGGNGDDRGNKLELYDMIRGGIEAYLEPRIEFFHRYGAEEMPTDLNDIGKRGAIPEGSPTINASREWLFTGYNITEKSAEVFDIEKTWLLSGRGGWNEKLYPEVEDTTGL